MRCLRLIFIFIPGIPGPPAGIACRRCWNCGPGARGLNLIGTGDFTHPAWREELRDKLLPAEEGLYRLKEEYRLREGAPAGEDRPARFIVTGEISSIYKKDGRVRKVHNVILLPGPGGGGGAGPAAGG